MIRRLMFWLAGALAVMLVAPILAPPLLAAPYKERIGDHVVRSGVPITPQVRAAVLEADRRVAASPSARYRASDQLIFLTGGGWRWMWLAGNVQGAMGFTRAVNDVVVLNRTEGDKVLGGPGVGERELAGVIAHEMTHGSLRAHFGVTVDFAHPAELREGYCDWVAQESSLTDARALELLRGGGSHPALIYWSGRKKVAAAMARPGMTVDRLFAEWDSNPS